MRYGIVGTGAIGGYYGSKLAYSGQEVHFLFHKDYEYVRDHGLQVDSCDGSFHLDQVNAYLSANLAYAADYINSNIPCIHTYVPQGTYLLWLDFSQTPLRGGELCEYLVKRC